jgi:hypothetical protein
MALKTAKATTPPELPQAIVPDIESLIADQILDDVNWQSVKQILIERAKQKFWIWLSAQLLPTDGAPMILNEVDAMAMGEGEER